MLQPVHAQVFRGGSDRSRDKAGAGSREDPEPSFPGSPEPSGIQYKRETEINAVINVIIDTEGTPH